MTIPIRGTAALVVAAAIMVVTLIWLPAYRLFFAISLVVAVLVAAGLQLWHKFHPVREEDISNKKPLGL